MTLAKRPQVCNDPSWCESVDSKDGDWPAERLTEAASAALGPTQVDRLERLAGGHSGLTWDAEVVVAGGGRKRVVVKAAPPGRKAVGRHDVLRQARAMAALTGVEGIVVPSVVFADTGEPPLYAVKWIEGDATQPVFDAPDTLEAVLRDRYLAATLLLAALHSAPCELLAEGEPVLDPAAELERWIPVLHARAIELGGEVDDLARLLAGTVPAAVAPRNRPW